MKNSILILIACVALLTISSCSSGTAPKDSSVFGPAIAAAADNNVERLIEQLEREWTAAIVKKDVATLDRLIAHDFNGTSPTAHTYPKSYAMDDLKSGRYSVEKMDLDEVSVNVYGDAAVAFTSQEEKSTYDGKDISGHYHYTDVWIKRNGQWQVVASHGSRFETGH